MRRTHIIFKGRRYGDLGKELPEVIMCPDSTIEEATLLAERLSNFYAGCEYIFYVGNQGEDY